MGAVATQDEGYVVPCSYADAASGSSSSTTMSIPPVFFQFQFAGPSGPTISVPLSELLTDATFTFANGEPACSLGINPVDTDLGGILLFGDSFIRNAYLVYDLERLEIAMAQARFDDISNDTNGRENNIIRPIPGGTTPLPGVTRTATQVQVDTNAFVTNTFFATSRSQQQVDTSTFTTVSSTQQQQVDSMLVPASATFDLGSGDSSRNAGAVSGMKGRPVLGLEWLGSGWVVFVGSVGLAAVLF